MKRLLTFESDRGVAAILVGASLVLMMGMAAVAIDLGRALNERRQDQTAADMAVMSASVDVLGGVSAIRDTALQFVQNNLDTTYGPSEWRALWTSCSDPTRNDGGFSFQSVPAPGGWGGGNLDCISVDPAGFIRVRVPNQVVQTTFGRVLGRIEIEAAASAIAQLGPRGSGGILPFALTSIPGSGDHVCMSSASGGLAEPPCIGPASGNFGTLGSPQYGNEQMQTAPNCTMSPTGQTLALNIAIGLDHLVSLYPPTSPTEVKDQCYNFAPNTMLTKTGFSGADVEAGLAGPLPGFSPPGSLPRLRASSNTVMYFGKHMDNTPLWAHIDGSLTAADIPASCVKSTFDNSTFPDEDFDGDGNPDRPESWQHMGKCLTDYGDGGGHSILFTDSIGSQARFAYVPQFWEDSLGDGTDWNHIRRFRAMWIQGTWWKKSAVDIKTFHPGEDCDSCTASTYDLTQLSGFVLPDSALPTDLRGDPPPWADGLNPFRPNLYR